MESPLCPLLRLLNAVWLEALLTSASSSPGECLILGLLVCPTLVDVTWMYLRTSWLTRESHYVFHAEAHLKAISFPNLASFFLPLTGSLRKGLLALKGSFAEVGGCKCILPAHQCLSFDWDISEMAVKLRRKVTAVWSDGSVVYSTFRPLCLRGKT